MKQQLKNTLAASLFVAAMLLTGSDGAYFPWPNLGGLLLGLAFFKVATPTEEQ